MPSSREVSLGSSGGKEERGARKGLEETRAAGGSGTGAEVEDRKGLKHCRGLLEEENGLW